jgi:hypothetical protein
MSWSVYAKGRPQKVAEYLDKQANNMSGESKAEYLLALPHIKSLVLQNFDDPNNNLVLSRLVSLEASGSGCRTCGSTEHPDGVPVSGSCQVKIKTIYAEL